MSNVLAPLDSRYSWLRLFTTLCISALGNVGMWAIVIIMPAVENEFNIDRNTVSLLYTVTMIGFGLGNFILGRLVDRHGIFIVLTFSALTIGTGFYVITLTSSVIIFCALQFLVGIGTAASFGPLIADVSHWFRRNRGIAVAIAASGNYLSGAIWPLLLSSVLSDFGWRSVYLHLSLLTIVGIIPLAFLLKTKNVLTTNLSESLNAESIKYKLSLSTKRLTYLLGLAGICCCVAMSMPQVHIVSYCAELGFGMSVGGQILSLMLAGGVISRLVFGFLADKLGGMRTLIIGSVLQGLALFFYLPFDGLISLYVVSLLFGLSQGGIVPSYAIVVRESMPSEEAGSKIGFIIMATIVGMAFGGWLSGWIFDVTGSYQLAFLNGILWNLFNLMIILFILFRSVANQKREK